MKKAIKSIRDNSALTSVLFSVLWIVIFLNTSAINQHFINDWLYFGGCLVLSFLMSAILVILIVMLKEKLHKSDEIKREK